MIKLMWKETTKKRDPRTGKPRETEKEVVAHFELMDSAKRALESISRNKACSDFKIVE